jgi:SAM-dependent methyltransferase
MSFSSYEVPTIDVVKDFWDARPCNVRHSKLELGTKEYFDEVEQRRYFVEPHILDFCKFGNWKNSEVLEIGCGIGTDGVNFVRAGAKYTGMELSEESLKIAKQRFGVYGLSADLLLGDAENADKILNGKKFDVIYSFGVIHHTPSIKNALKAIRNLSHEGTTVLVMIYAKNSYKQAMIDVGLDQPEAQYGCPIANSYSIDEASNLFLEAGFRNIKISQDHIFQYKIEDYKEYKYVKEPWFEAMPEEVLSAMKRKFGWHLLIEASI